MPDCLQVTDLKVHFIGQPVIEVRRNPGNGQLVNIVLASDEEPSLDVTRVWVILREADARRLHEALGAVLGSEAHAHA